jgi:hypothetical protein
VKVEGWLFGAGAFFFVPVGVIYGILTHWDEPVGSVALLLTGGLAAMVGWYLWYTARHIDPRPEDDPVAPIEAGSGEYGFFAPHSWWPLALALTAATIFLGLAVGWWLMYIGLAVAAFALIGWVFEYWRGVHAH